MSQPGYKQFCPVAMAAEILCTRWTMVLMRELIAGTTRFNELRRGVPKMSPTLLSQRLTELEDAGVIERKPLKTEKGVFEYHLTTAGKDLRPVVEAMGFWGQKWVESQISLKNLDPSLLMWDMHRNIDTSFFGDERKVLQFEFVDYATKMRFWWLVVTGDIVDICLKNPGHEVDLMVQAKLKAMTQIWMGDLSVSKAKRQKLIRVSGDSALNKTMASWIGCSQLSSIKPAV